MPGFNMSQDQSKAVEKIVEWYTNSPKNSRFLLTGPAGTGKTTLALHVVEALGLDVRRDVAFVSPTGMAARRLSTILAEQGAPGVPTITIHSAIYATQDENQENIRSLYRQLDEVPADDLGTPELEERRAKILQTIEELSRPTWHLKSATKVFSGRRPYLKLIVCDEASMVTDEIAKDLSSYGIPVLALGDPYQLPPVDPEAPADHRPDFSNRTVEPVSELTTDHRASTDKLAEFTRAVRDRGVAPEWNGKGGRLSNRIGIDTIVNNFDMVIVGTNRTRWTIVTAIRAHKGIPLTEPVVGDRIICLSNDPENGAVNGQIVEVTGVRRPTFGRERLIIDWRDASTGQADTWQVYACGFEGESGEKRARRMARGSGVIAATFADAITCHKAQGSQWGRVLVKDEGLSFRTSLLEWRYTAMTRATEMCAVV